VGFEYFDDDAFEGVAAALEPRSLAERVDRDERCCYAKKRAVWARDPQGLRWEFYRVQADLERFADGPVEARGASSSAPASEARQPAAACGCGA
jgi:hypothetical protein